MNEPEILEQIAAPGAASLDLTPLLADARNVLLMAQGGGIFFNWHEAGLYEVHTNFLPEYRGKHAFQASLAAYRWMFTRTDCMALLTRVPATNRGARMFCGAVGATREFDRKAIWPTKHGLVDVSFWALRYDDWVRKTPSLSEIGREFHARLDAEFARHRALRGEHPDDEWHDRHVGACVEMIYGGQPEKGVVLYNRWARFAGYGMIGIAAHNPLLIDIGDALLQVIDGSSFKVLKCR